MILMKFRRFGRAKIIIDFVSNFLIRTLEKSKQSAHLPMLPFKPKWPKSIWQLYKTVLARGWISRMSIDIISEIDRHARLIGNTAFEVDLCNSPITILWDCTKVCNQSISSTLTPQRSPEANPPAVATPPWANDVCKGGVSTGVR